MDTVLGAKDLFIHEDRYFIAELAVEGFSDFAGELSSFRPVPIL